MLGQRLLGREIFKMWSFKLTPWPWLRVSLGIMKEALMLRGLFSYFVN